MNFTDNLTDSLMEEVLMDAAGNFFDSRREIEDMIKFIGDCVDNLREKEKLLEKRAGALSYLLLDESNVKDFFHAIETDMGQTSDDVDGDLLEKLIKAEPSDSEIPKNVPLALTSRGEYIKRVFEIYENLRTSVDSYINGENYEWFQKNNSDRQDVYYNLIKNMVDLVNDKVAQVNQNQSPRSMLNFAKRLDPFSGQKQSITGGSTFDTQKCGLNEKLAFKPVNFESLDLQYYPRLLPLRQVESRIVSFLKPLYSSHKKEIKKIMIWLKRK
ncbi:hypothetical protein QUF76_07085 [Desulfobacterales bacterium HSG16]|nr:hypothetical protein [Desulfobacterales bacterium HSG16]